MDIYKLADQARRSISSYCVDECSSFCCRKGYISLNEKEAVLLTNNKLNEALLSESLKKLGEDEYVLDLNKGCSQLKDGLCEIHSSSKRPDACKKFPVFIRGDKIHISDRCPALRAGKFYVFIRRCESEGFVFE